MGTFSLRATSSYRVCAAEVDTVTALKGASITQLIESVTDQQKMKKQDGYQSTSDVHTF